MPANQVQGGNETWPNKRGDAEATNINLHQDWRWQRLTTLERCRKCIATLVTFVFKYCGVVTSSPCFERRLAGRQGSAFIEVSYVITSRDRNSLVCRHSAYRHVPTYLHVDPARIQSNVSSHHNPPRRRMCLADLSDQR